MTWTRRDPTVDAWVSHFSSYAFPPLSSLGFYDIILFSWVGKTLLIRALTYDALFTPHEFPYYIALIR